MLDEAKELQNEAVEQCEKLLQSDKNSIVFKAPTGSGKTFMMAKLMNNVLSKRSDIVFLVSALSKGGLAQQNEEKFEEYKHTGMFPNLNPFLIDTDNVGEGKLEIPSNHNVYILPTAKNKKNGILHKGALVGFYEDLRHLGKHIWLIKDECHIATTALDEQYAKYMEKSVLFSATPKLKKTERPDVEISEADAVNAYLIKRVIADQKDSVDITVALDKLISMQNGYRKKLGINPCLIVQISNSDKGNVEIENLKKIFQMPRYQNITWMYIVDDGRKCDTNDKIRMLPVKKWKEYAKEPSSRIDVIVFKLTITEGWDIPRACLLYQMRDTKSKQLDEQVIGRVRRNPRLLDFEMLPSDAQELASVAYVWGDIKDGIHISNTVKLADGVSSALKIHTTRLKKLEEHQEFDVNSYLEKQSSDCNEDFFTLCDKLAGASNDIVALCRQYTGDDPQKWYRFMNNYDAIKTKAEACLADYDQMEVGPEMPLPAVSFFEPTDFDLTIPDWVWIRTNASTETEFSFDSNAERDWAKILFTAISGHDITGTVVSGTKTRYLWGKNFPFDSDIKFAYYNDGIHESYPDFVMKDREGNIRIFEVKSLNKSAQHPMDDEEEYEQKINALIAGYTASSKLLDYVFYVPIQIGPDWKIHKIKNGQDTIIELAQLKDELKFKTVA